MDLKKEKEINDIIAFFNRQVSNILKAIDSGYAGVKNNADFDRIRRIAKIARDEDPPCMLERCTEKLWDNREAIMTRNVDFLIKPEVAKKYIKDDDNKEWLESVMEFVRNKHKDLGDAEIEYLWKCIDNMLQCVIKYQIARGEFQR